MRTSKLAIPFLFLTLASGCKNENAEEWTTSQGVTVTALPVEENGKKYLNIFYENFGQDTVSRIKYTLITMKGGKADTAEKQINPTELFYPKDRHLVPRAIGEKEYDGDQVMVENVLVIKEKGKKKK
jgi:hypothetical protein